jgi:hypothetical protein
MKNTFVTIDIPDSLQIYAMEADGDNPHITFIDEDFSEIKIDMPKQLAYYLTTHFCGSTKMRRNLIDKGAGETRAAIREALGIKET